MSAGYPLLTDDLLVLGQPGAGFLAYPGIPRVKLFPNIAKLIFGLEVRGKKLELSDAEIDHPAQWHAGLAAPRAAEGDLPSDARPAGRRNRNGSASGVFHPGVHFWRSSETRSIWRWWIRDGWNVSLPWRPFLRNRCR